MDDPFFLGHRRLSIIDLEGGLQPMASADGRFIVCFNGEIYNYLELKAELARHGAVFRTASDTEVLLHGYRHWGTALVEHLIGMFAFALVDRLEQSVFLARDRFGEKPLFISESEASITFASELKALVSLSDQPRRLSSTALFDYLCLNYVPGNDTLLKGIKRLAPGSYCQFQANRKTCRAYYRPGRAELKLARDPTLTEAVEELEKRIDHSVRLAVRSDVPVTLFLSGGIDSSVVAQSAVRHARLKDAYCLDFPEQSYSEWPNAQRVAKKLGLELRRVELSPARLTDLRTLVEHADDPLADSSALPVWVLSAAVAKDYKVALSGDGGDELFGGYLTYKATSLHRHMARLPKTARALMVRAAHQIRVTDQKVSTPYKLWRFLRAADLPSNIAHFTFNGTWLPTEAAELLRGGSGAGLEGLVERHGLPKHPTLSELQQADASDYLPNDILTKVDRMTMAHGLEARAPLLIPEIADYALALPDRLKLRAFGQPKRVLREVLTRTLGKEVGHAKKQGFSIPVHRWLRGPLRNSLDDLVNQDSLDKLELIETGKVLARKQRHLEGQAQLGFELWGLMVLVAWHQARVESRPVPSNRKPLRRLRFPFSRSESGSQFKLG